MKHDNESVGGGGGANGINGELLKGFSIFSIEKVSILCHFMPLKNLEFQENLFKFSCFYPNFEVPISPSIYEVPPL